MQPELPRRQPSLFGPILPLGVNSSQVTLGHMEGIGHPNGAELMETLLLQGIRQRRTRRSCRREELLSQLCSVAGVPLCYGMRRAFLEDSCPQVQSGRASSKRCGMWKYHAADPANPHLAGCLCWMPYPWLIFPCGRRASLTDGEAGRQLPRDGDCIWRCAPRKGRLPSFGELNCC